MFSTNCTHCHKTSLVNLENIISTHRSLEGTVAYVRCHCGGIAVHVFDRPKRVTDAWAEESREIAYVPAS